MPRNYGTAFPAFVNIGTTNPLKYAFKCRLQGREVALTQLGITKLEIAAITETLINRMVLGCNSPKPARASKLFQTIPPGHESSFVSTGSIGTARQNGWKITPGKPYRRATVTPRSKTVYVTVNGIKYAWQFALVGGGATVDLASIGVIDATSTMDDLVWGCDFPKPPKVGRDINDNEDPEIDNFSTFADPNRELAVGWRSLSVKGSNRTKAEDLIAMI